MFRHVFFLVVIFMSCWSTACGEVRKSEGNQADSLLFNIDGAPYDVTLIHGIDEFSADDQRFGVNWAHAIYSEGASGFCLMINVHPSHGIGALTLRPALYPPSDVPWLLLVRCDADMQEAYMPVFDSVINVRESGGDHSRLSISFDSLVMRNACGEQLILTGGEIDVRLLSTQIFPERAFDLLGDQPIAFEESGFGALGGEDTPFTSLYLRFRDEALAEGSLKVEPANLCLHELCTGDEQGMRLYLPTDITSGEYAIDELVDEFSLVDLRSSDPEAINGTLWHYVYSGRVAVTVPEQASGFVTLRVLEPWVFRGVVSEGGQSSWSDTRQVTFDSGMFYIWKPSL